jgi:hypothetical protein
MEVETAIILLIAINTVTAYVAWTWAKSWQYYKREADRQADLIAPLQDKLFNIADATRNGKSGTARMVYRMTGRSHD